VDIRNKDHEIEAYLFQHHVGDPGINAVRDSLVEMQGVRFVGQFIGAFSLFARVVSPELGELQRRIGDDYARAGVGSTWSVNLTAKSAAAPKRGSPDMCALVLARIKGDPFEFREMLDADFLDIGDEVPHEGAAVITALDWELLVDLGGDTVEDVLERVAAFRALPGVKRTATAIADITTARRSDT
jgi:hypothetical protein